MRKTTLFKALSIVSLCALSFSAFAETELASPYQISYQAPAWKLANKQQDPDGYTFQYQPANAQKHFESITVNYGKGIQSSLKDSMQQVVSEMNTTGCQTRESSILKEDTKTLVFKTVLDQCTNGKSLTQIFKVFNTPDGQYSIVYSVDSVMHANKSPDKMESIIESAKLTPTKQHS